MQESSLAKIPEVDVKLELGDPPTREEIKKATTQPKVRKSPGIDGIPAEVWGAGGGGEQCSINSRICSPIAGRKGLYRRTSGMQSLSLCTKTSEKNRTVQTIEGSPYSPSWVDA